MPRGVAMPDAREQLLQAAERVLAREGPAGLTSRAITDEAGVAKGLIYRYFTDLEELLAELTTTWMHVAVGAVGDLPERAGSRSVTDNLCDAMLVLFGPGSHVPMATALVTSRPDLMAALHQSVHHTSVFGQVEESLVAYLAAERRLGRVARNADTRAGAIILLGAVHHLVFTRRIGHDYPFAHEVRRIIDTVLSGLEGSNEASGRGK